MRPTTPTDDTGSPARVGPPAQRRELPPQSSDILSALGVTTGLPNALAHVVDQASDGVYLLHEKRYVYVNAAFCEVTGYTRDELTDPLFDYNVLLPQAAQSQIRDRYERHKTGQPPPRRYDVRAVHKSGRLVDLEVSVTRVGGGADVTVLGIVRDVSGPRGSERRLQELVNRRTADLEEALAELAERSESLSRSNAELEQFAYAASHDLQEPLRVIVAFTELLQQTYREALPKEAQGWLDLCRAAATRMHHQVTALLELSRVDARPVTRSVVDFQDLLREVVADLSVRIEESDGDVRWSELPCVQGDRRQLRLLLHNLIGNGLKFHGPGVRPVVEVSGRLEGGSAVIEVRDNGIGIAEQHHSRAFGFFKRLQTRDKYEGTGMGLALCHKIVQAHGGGISVVSAVGQGSLFRVHLPRGVPRLTA